MNKSARYLASILLLIPAGALFIAVAPPATTLADVPQEFSRSLLLRVDRVIAESSHPTMLWLTQNAPVSYHPVARMQLHLSLAPATPNAPIVKELGTFEIPPRDILQKPIAIAAQTDGVADGNYRLVAKIVEGDTPLATLEQPIWLVKGIDARRGPIVERMAKIEGHESTKATIMYPFDVARVVNEGRRGYNAEDLGINQASQPNYLDFAAEMKHSEELLAALEAGKDPLWKAKGDSKRHYYFADADEIMPYRVWIPPTWDGTMPLPMVFILHGNTRNQDFYFERDGQIIPKTAEKHGFMLVGVFGFHPNGGYNLSAMRATGRGPGRGAAAPAFGPAPARGRAGGANSFLDGMPQARIGELSEADTLHVLELVKKEYPIDPKRTFLFGYSAGGNGGYYIGGKYADNFAAIAIGGANTSLTTGYPYYEKLKALNTPFMIYYGERDNVQNGSRASVQALTQAGISAELKTYPGADHDSAPAAATPDAFEFFNTHARK